jgi:predicted SprT family Zn-dependent metalloprotease
MSLTEPAVTGPRSLRDPRSREYAIQTMRSLKRFLESKTFDAKHIEEELQLIIEHKHWEVCGFEDLDAYVRAEVGISLMSLDRTIQDDDDLGVLSPTEEAYRSFYLAFEVFNRVLFGNKLPDVMITMQRSKRSRGYFSGERFGHRRGTEIVDEIALNPRAFADRTDRQIVSTLVHEMTHLWQYHFGKPSRRSYHNKEWAAKMREIGLMPSHTGEPGGKQTGQRVTHYIIDGGSYDTEWKLLADSGFTLDYQDRFAVRPEEPRKLKVRYACPSCSVHVWGKPNIRIVCADCSTLMK